jgi:hypothetical protein
MKVVDYFSSVDRDGDSRVEFSEALEHCFPHLPAERLDTLKKWLHPQKHYELLFPALLAFAKEVAINEDFKESDQDVEFQGFMKTLASIQQRCKDFIQEHLKDSARVSELQALNKGFVSNFAVTRILRVQHKGNSNIIEKLKKWEEKMQSEVSVNVFNRQGPNFFSATIFAISSAIQKLSRESHAPSNCALYRGYKDITIPQHLDGYCEFGFLSTSKDISIAQNMANGGRTEHGVVITIEAPIGGHADIEQYSQCVLTSYHLKHLVLTFAFSDFVEKQSSFSPRCLSSNSKN